jgi:hypothetical protein
MATLVVQDHHRNALAETKVCLYCGAPAAVLRYRKFTWCPPWVYALVIPGVIPYVIVAWVLTKRKGLNIPLCAAHQNHFLWRQALGILGVLCVVGFLYAAMSLAEVQPETAGGDVAEILFMATPLLMAVALIVTTLVHKTAIRPVKITDRSITLERVSREFIEVYARPRPEVALPIDADVGDHWAPEKAPQTNIATGPGQPGPDDVIDLSPDAIQEGR